MMGAAGRWLLSLISVSLICAVADALMPRGAVRRVGKLVCGLTLTLAVLTPLLHLDGEEARRWLEDCLSQAGQEKEFLTQEVGGQLKTIIEQDCAAYIVDKAAQLGLTCSARVECRETQEGIYLPVRAEVYGVSQEKGRELAEAIAQDLGVPKEEIYLEEEVP